MSHEVFPDNHQNKNVLLNPYGAGVSEASELHPDANFDDYLIDYTGKLYGVFDGVGNDGNAASSLAVSELYEFFKPQSGVMSERIAHYSMLHGLKKAHVAIKEQAGGARTTAALVRFFTTHSGDQRAIIAHSGDSRVYRLREGWQLGSLTLDHSIDTPTYRNSNVEDAWKRQNKLSDVTSPNELSVTMRALFNNRNRIRASLGQATRNVPTSMVTSTDVQEGDIFLLTTDGVHDNLTTKELSRLLSRQGDPKSIAANIVATAKSISQANEMRSKSDDMTAVVVTVPRKK